MPFLLIVLPAKAEEINPTAGEAERWSILVTYGEDDCPESVDGEIVVCARHPEEERYRIPKAVRDREKEEEAHYAMSWTAQFQNHEDDARLGRPNSCSTKKAIRSRAPASFSPRGASDRKWPKMGHNCSRKPCLWQQTVLRTTA